MNLVLRNDFALPVRLRQRTFNDAPLDRFMNSILTDFFSPALRQEAVTTTPRLNVVETDQAYQVEAELPGVYKEDVKISVKKRLVTIEAETKDNAEKKEGENIIHAERTIRKYARSFSLPTEVDEDRAEAKLENGVLLLKLPKKEEIQPKQITVQ
jgi:HSP20 family protein